MDQMIARRLYGQQRALRRNAGFPFFLPGTRFSLERQPTHRRDRYDTRCKRSAFRALPIDPGVGLENRDPGAGRRPCMFVRACGNRHKALPHFRGDENDGRVCRNARLSGSETVNRRMGCDIACKLRCLARAFQADAHRDSRCNARPPPPFWFAGTTHRHKPRRESDRRRDTSLRAGELGQNRPRRHTPPFGWMRPRTGGAHGKRRKLRFRPARSGLSDRQLDLWRGRSRTRSPHRSVVLLPRRHVPRRGHGRLRSRRSLPSSCWRSFVTMDRSS